MIRIIITKCDYEPAVVNLDDGEDITPNEADFLGQLLHDIRKEEKEAGATHRELSALTEACNG